MPELPEVETVKEKLKKEILNRVITDDRDLMKSRVALVYSIKTVLKNALDILGVTAPERM